MRWLLNAAYMGLLLILVPLILWRMLRHGRYRRGLSDKFLGTCRAVADHRPCVWFHAVSVGEVIQLQKVVEEFRRQTKDDFRIVVSTSTDTGYDLATRRFPECQLIWFPLDFSWAVGRALRLLKPRLVVLMELEIWPNFVSECARLRVPVSIVNARMSDRSVKGYRRFRWFLKPVFARLSLVAAQSQQYADRLQSLGVHPDRLHVTGSVKFDGVQTSRSSEATDCLRTLLQITENNIVFIAGSTQAPEEQLALNAWRSLQDRWPQLKLILVPRHRERFDEVAELVQRQGISLIRRSQLPGVRERQPPDMAPDVTTGNSSSSSNPIESAGPTSVILLDTIGELNACWGLADIAFVGGSFGSRGGQNMIEPAAYGAAVMFGPNTSNFRDVVALFREANACLQLKEPSELQPALKHFLENSDDRQKLGLLAQNVVLSQQGATAATARLLCQLVVSVRGNHSCQVV